MSALLNQYFERYAEEAITKMKAALIAVDYYERIRLRLVKKEDLSGELAIIAKVGPAGTMTVVKEAIADYKGQVAGAWALNQRLQEIGKHKVSLIVNEREHLPRAETFKLDINAGKNPMAAQIACIELEKQLTFIALTD